MDALIGMRTQESNRLGVAHSLVEPSIKEHLAYLDSEIEKLKKQMRAEINNDPDLKGKWELLVSIPGISDATIAVILAEIDFQKFESVREVVAFMGLAPKDTLSGSSVKGKPRLCKIGNARLRTCFYMPAMVAIRFNPVVAEFHHRLKENGKNGKVIVCAAMRKLVHIIYGVLKTGKTVSTRLNDKILPFYDEHGMQVLRVLTDRGPGYCGRTDTQYYDLFLHLNGIEHTKTKPRHPQTNGCV